MLAVDKRPQVPHVPWWQHLSPSRLLGAGAGCLMLCASVLPWLVDPLGKVYSAWELPIDIGWQFHTDSLNYGLLCLCCAISVFFLTWIDWKKERGTPLALSSIRSDIVCGWRLASLLCLVPVTLFFLQYLVIDVTGINLLAQHKIQALLMQQHFGYKVGDQRLPLSPFDLTTSTLIGRLTLLIDQVSIGFLLPLVSTTLLIFSLRSISLSGGETSTPATQTRHKLIWLAGLLVLLVVFGRAPAALASEYEAKASLAEGNYASALYWLNAALFFNPALDQVAYYHSQRGQALYFLHPDEQSDDSRAYLALTYHKQGDYREAYQQLLAVWQVQRTSWVVDELSISLARLSEFIQPLNGPPIIRPDNDDTALPWLQRLSLLDPSNVYSRYVVGRIQYDLHNYKECAAQMLLVTQMSTDRDIQSSAYTYMALSDAGQGNYEAERKLLFKAVALDQNYHNNTAREELSGLR